MRFEFCTISKQFGKQQALRDVTLSVSDFHSLAIIGPSGGGKTTLLSIIAGLERPETGRLSIDEEWLDFSEESLLSHRRSIGSVFRADNLFPHLTAKETSCFRWSRDMACR